MLKAAAPLLHLLARPQTRAFFLAAWVVGWAVVLYMSLKPLDALPLGLSDKVLHFSGYAAMTALTVGFCHAPRRLLLLALATAAASGGIELIQGLLPYRSCDLRDFLANAAGAGVGLLLALGWLALVLRPYTVSRPLPS